MSPENKLLSEIDKLKQKNKELENEILRLKTKVIYPLANRCKALTKGTLCAFCMLTEVGTCCMEVDKKVDSMEQKNES